MVSESKLESDFRDARFATGETAGTELDYWYDSDRNGFWVEIASLAVGENILYFYYGNTNASAVSNAANTMLFYDNFDDNDITDWTTRNGSGFSASSGMLRCDNNSTSAFNLISANNSMSHSDVMVMYKM